MFLNNGYPGTTMEEIAALARVSKQTVYKQFADKERLFSEIVTAEVRRDRKSQHRRSAEAGRHGRPRARPAPLCPPSAGGR